jgi:hypothetical protein
MAERAFSDKVYSFACFTLFYWIYLVITANTPTFATDNYLSLSQEQQQEKAHKV